MGRSRKPAIRAANRRKFEGATHRKAFPLGGECLSLNGIVLVALVFVALNLIIYAPSLKYGFLQFDDSLYVTENAGVARGLSWAGFSWAFNVGYAANWHPLTWLSHMLDVQLYGMAGESHHLTNVVLHILNSLLLFWLLYRTTRAWRPSTLVALLFAVHPLHVESVAWIAERKDVLSTLFWMLTFHAYVSYVRRPLYHRYLAILALFCFGLMAKPMLVTLPLVLLLFDIWPLGRLSLGSGQRRVWLKLLVEKIPLFALSAVSSVFTVLAQSRGGAVQNFEMLSLSQRVANAVVSYFMYIAQMLWPGDLIAYYHYEPPAVWLIVVSVLILGAVSGLVVWIAKRYPFLLVGWIWYLCTLLPVIGLVQVGAQSRADRYTYVPLIGLFIIAAWGIPKLLEGRRHLDIGLGVTAAIVICALTALARNQVRYWENDIILWEHAVRAAPGSCFARTNLGTAFVARGDLNSAIDQYTEALRINPNFAEAHNSIGIALAKKGLWREAEFHYSEALRVKPGWAEVRINRGIVLGNLGKLDEAVSEFLVALKIDPNSAEAHSGLGIVLAKKGLWREAELHYLEALRIKPDYIEAHTNRGTLLGALGKTDEAISEFLAALKIDPRQPEIYYDLGFALARKGRLDEAVNQYVKALEIQPLFAEAHTELGNALLLKREIDNAIEHYEKSLEINPELAHTHTNLGLALMYKNRFAEAIIHFREALRINPNSTEAKRDLEIAQKRQ
jgi:protein O-mannosyl-transferase